MKKFKDFVSKKQKEPVLITAQPVHGSHACVKPPKELVKEANGEHYNHPETHYTDEWFSKHDNDHIGNGILKTHKALSIPSDEYKKHPSHKSLNQYTDSSYQINDELVKHHNDPQNMSQKNARHTAHIDHALNNSHLEHDVHVYHGTYKWNPGIESKKNVAGHVKIPTFMSTSINKKWAHRFSGARWVNDSSNKEMIARNNPKGAHVLHIHLKKGQKGMYIGNNSMAGNEHELLLPRNQTLKIHPKPTVLRDGTHIWHTKVVDQE